MDDTPKAFLEELRSSLLKRSVGQIALAVVLAEAAWQLVKSLVWYLVVPLLGKMLQGNTESVLFAGSAHPFPWENLFGSVLEFILVVILVFYLNRWVQRRPLLEHSAPDRAMEHGADDPAPVNHDGKTQAEYNLIGEALDPAESPDNIKAPTP